MIKTEKRKKGDEGPASMSRAQLGEAGEEVAFLYLKKNGYKILDRNYENRFGEIDIIAKMGKTIIFVEVKSVEARLQQRGLYPERNVDRKKQGKLIRTAEYYLIKNKYPEYTSWQIDVIGVELNIQKRLANLRHTKSAVSV